MRRPDAARAGPPRKLWRAQAGAPTPSYTPPYQRWTLAAVSYRPGRRRGASPAAGVRARIAGRDQSRRGTSRPRRVVPERRHARIPGRAHAMAAVDAAGSGSHRFLLRAASPAARHDTALDKRSGGPAKGSCRLAGVGVIPVPPTQNRWDWRDSWTVDQGRQVRRALFHDPHIAFDSLVWYDMEFAIFGADARFTQVEMFDCSANFARFNDEAV